jgi:hypothetical protein
VPQGRDSRAGIGYRAGATSQEGDEPMAEHKRGSMDIRDKERTFFGFLRFVQWVVWITFGVLVFLALVNA